MKERRCVLNTAPTAAAVSTAVGGDVQILFPYTVVAMGVAQWIFHSLLLLRFTSAMSAVHPAAPDALPGGHVLGERSVTGPLDLIDHGVFNKPMRYHAYRNFILWW